MTFQGRIENGVVVFDEPIPLRSATSVRVEAEFASDYWRHRSLDEIANEQGVGAPASFEAILGTGIKRPCT